MAITQKHTIDIQPGISAPTVVHCSCGDFDSVISFEVMNGGELFDCSSYVWRLFRTEPNGMDFAQLENWYRLRVKKMDKQIEDLKASIATA